MLRQVDARFLILSAILLHAGCSDVEPDPSRAGEDATGIPSLQLELRTTIDGYELEAGSIREVLVDDSGRIYVLDQAATAILVLEPDGTRVGAVGGPGEGPGEFVALSSIAWAGPLLVAFDVRQQRFSFFRPDGEFVSTHSLDVPRLQAGSPSLLSGGSRAYARLQNVRTDSLEYVVIRGADSVRVVPSLPEPPRLVGGFLCATQDGSGFFPGIPMPFQDRNDLRAFLPEGEVALASQDSFAIHVHDVQGGGRVRSIRREHPRRALTDEDWESLPETQNVRTLDEERGPLLDQAERGPCPYDENRPDYWPALRAIFSDPAGRIWAESTNRTGRGTTLTVFDASGRPLGEAAMPDRDRSVRPVARDDRLYIGTVDDLGVQSIEVYEVTVPSR